MCTKGFCGCICACEHVRWSLKVKKKKSQQVSVMWADPGVLLWTVWLWQRGGVLSVRKTDRRNREQAGLSWPLADSAHTSSGRLNVFFAGFENRKKPIKFIEEQMNHYMNKSKCWSLHYVHLQTLCFCIYLLFCLLSPSCSRVSTHTWMCLQAGDSLRFTFKYFGFACSSLYGYLGGWCLYTATYTPPLMEMNCKEKVSLHACRSVQRGRYVI